MGTTDLVKFLAEEEFTDDQAYNLIVADLFQACTEKQVEEGQRLIGYFMYKIQNVCLPAIRAVKATTRT